MVPTNVRFTSSQAGEVPTPLIPIEFALSKRPTMSRLIM